LTKHTSKKK
jgi:hypothetical protein